MSLECDLLHQLTLAVYRKMPSKLLCLWRKWLRIVPNFKSTLKRFCLGLKSVSWNAAQWKNVSHLMIWNSFMFCLYCFDMYMYVFSCKWSEFFCFFKKLSGAFQNVFFYLRTLESSKKKKRNLKNSNWVTGLRLLFYFVVYFRMLFFVRQIFGILKKKKKKKNGANLKNSNSISKHTHKACTTHSEPHFELYWNAH